ncbi:uncharacterized protein K02A2.6-like [Rhipicephalus sanguineus]|uniref:uncharacterized protein K02A2.6-like n=1 Tax=Rhipicephalus sanguineus TaxID=34632 RepID=UPI001894700D|nr:uncharacterized protein K02A2.6-like [Rhipicephalus sanguineus]
MDLLGPFPTSTYGNKWIAVASDYLTRYAETTPLPSSNATEVASYLVNIALRHGAPEVLITDRGTIFTAELTQQILRLSHTMHRRTTADHLQTNGLTERLNKTLVDMLAMYVDVEQKTWDDILLYVTLAYKTAPQEKTKVTPFEPVFCSPVATILDAMLPHADHESMHADVAGFLQRAEEVRQLVRTRVKEQQHTDTRLYNLRRRHLEYAPGDRIMVWTLIRRRGLREKLLRRYYGPYKITQRLGPLSTKLSLMESHNPNGDARPEIVHAVRLKKFFEH